MKKKGKQENAYTETQIHNPIPIVVNPRRACAARVTVVGLFVCPLHLTSRTFVRIAISTTYSTGSEGQNFVGFSLKMLRCRARALTAIFTPRRTRVRSKREV